MVGTPIRKSGCLKGPLGESGKNREKAKIGAKRFFLATLAQAFDPKSVMI